MGAGCACTLQTARASLHISDMTMLKVFAMSLKRPLHRARHPARPVEQIRQTSRQAKGLDVRSLVPTQPMTEEKKAERYRSGRFAEMTDAQAGL